MRWFGWYMVCLLDFLALCCEFGCDAYYYFMYGVVAKTQFLWLHLVMATLHFFQKLVLAIEFIWLIYYLKTSSSNVCLLHYPGSGLL